MEQKNGPWTVLKSEQKYKDDFVALCADDVLKPTGKPGSYATVRLLKGAAVLPIDEDENVYLVRQFRYALGAESTEVICGSMEEGEAPEAAARREAKEEWGIEAKAWKDLGAFQLETSIIQCPVHLFIARHLQFTDNHPDDTEDIKKIKIPLQKAVQMVLQNEIIHGPSCVLILKAQALKNQ